MTTHDRTRHDRPQQERAGHGQDRGDGTPRDIVVVGNGMVGERVLGELARVGVLDRDRVTVIGEERRAAYDRVHLSAYVGGTSADDLGIADAALRQHPNLVERLGERVTRIDRDAQVAHTDAGLAIRYDHLVLATGSRPFVPPIPGADLPACHVYRTIDDLDGIRRAAAGARHGVVLGGGLLGLEAANALQLLGLDVTVVEFAPRLMPRQLDAGAAAALRSHVERLGIQVLTDTATQAITDRAGRGIRLSFSNSPALDTDLVVFSAGIRARDDLARDAGLPVGERGGVVVDAGLVSADPAISAVGECACVDGQVYGLVGPGYGMARVLAERLAGGDATFDGADTSTQLKLLGIDVASFGDALGSAEGCRTAVYDDPVDAVHRRIVTSADGRRILGGILVGDASGYDRLLRLTLSGRQPGVPLAALAAPQVDVPASGAGDLVDDDLVCTCTTVTKAQVCDAVRHDGATTLADLKAQTGAGTGCGSCTVLCKRILDQELTAQGIEVDTSLCAHFAMTRQELWATIAVRGHRTFAAVLAEVGTGDGCEVCKPTVASILATLHNEHVLDPDHAPLQDTNDRFLANIQRDGTYSVVPRIPGGEITPTKLMVIAEVAQDFDLYTKITGGQRIDLFGARLEQLPAIWQRLVDAGFESGHAYGKALRTVKSCVGQSWCRYGVQDSTTMAINLEERYRGLRSPHKIKMAVSGCKRECAEAQSKDVGVIATEQGWNLYVGGNGGTTPQHAVLLATDLSATDLIRLIDRFLAYYVRTADKLERTATWLNRVGLDHVRAVVVDDDLGLAADLDALIAHHVDTYTCEWAAALDDPARRSMFTSYLDDDGPDVYLTYVTERGQRRPAGPADRRSLPVLSTTGAGAAL